MTEMKYEANPHNLRGFFSQLAFIMCVFLWLGAQKLCASFACVFVFHCGCTHSVWTCAYLHVEIRIDVLLLHQLFDLFSPFDQFSDFFGQDSHFQIGIWNFRNFLCLVLLLPWKKMLKKRWNFSLVDRLWRHFTHIILLLRVLSLPLHSGEANVELLDDWGV